jgi:hypothetical protein
LPSIGGSGGCDARSHQKSIERFLTCSTMRP